MTAKITKGDRVRVRCRRGDLGGIEVTIRGGEAVVEGVDGDVVVVVMLGPKRHRRIVKQHEIVVHRRKT